jgi:putative DNA primase/helicase
MWLFLYGKKGDNGKSTFLEVLMTLFGDYATKLPMQTLLQTQSDTSRYRNDIASLVGMRLVIASEIESNRRLNESLVKDLTGNDTLVGNELYQRSFKFRPAGVLWMYGNYQPIIRGTDDAIWGRVKLIPFEVQIPKAQQDTRLRQKLLAELPGILAWAVQGCLDWQAQGLEPSATVTMHTAQYRGAMDTVGRFLQECCVEGKHHRIAFGLLFAEYQNWCVDNDEDALTSPRFAKDLTERGFASIRGTGNMVMRKGITLKSVAAASP